MALYDIIDEITERQVTKTETGDSRVWGVLLGIVAKNYNADMGGRICVTIPTRDKDANELQWARLSMPSSGEGWGHYFLPEVGDQVLLAFEGGNIEKPYVIGCVPKDTHKFLKDSVDENNQVKRIVTHHGSTIRFEDNKDDQEGKKDKLTLQTAGKMLTILMDNENQKLIVQDKDKKNYVELNVDPNINKLTVQIQSKIEIKVGDKITMMLNGESGGVTIKADTIRLEGANQVSLKSDTSVKMESAQVSAKASNMLSLSSDGSSKLGGSTISVG